MPERGADRAGAVGAAAEAVRKAFAAWDDGDLEATLELFDEAVEIHPILGPTWRGHEGVLGMTADWIEGLADWRMTLEEVYEAGDHVVAGVHQSARGEASGAPVESDYWFTFTFASGRVVRWDMHTSREDAHASVAR